MSRLRPAIVGMVNRMRSRRKDLLKEGKDPSTEKQFDKHRQVVARPFEQWADEWFAKKKVERVKRGRIVAVRDPKTIEVLELRAGYVKARFGKLCRQDILSWNIPARKNSPHAFLIERSLRSQPGAATVSRRFSRRHSLAVAGRYGQSLPTRRGNLDPVGRYHPTFPAPA